VKTEEVVLPGPAAFPAPRGRTLGVHWFLATVIGGSGGWIVFYGLTGLALALRGPHVFAGSGVPAGGFLSLRAVIGLSLGAAQAGVWYRHRHRTSMPTVGIWIAASLGGWMLGMLLLLVWTGPLSAPVWTVVGALLGSGQALALRAYGRAAFVWPLVNAGGFAVGAGIGYPLQTRLLQGVAGDPSTFGWTVAVMLVEQGIIMLGVGASTGLAVAWLVRRSPGAGPADRAIPTSQEGR